MLIVINKFLSLVAITLIVCLGLYFTWKLRFVQFNFYKVLTSLKDSKKDDCGISPFSSLMMVLAGRIGVGSISGVALAIYLGGPGSIFWMWIVTVIAASSTFMETILGLFYKEIDEGSLYKGGPSYYIKKGLGLKKVGALYAVVVLIGYIIGFLGIQANTIVVATKQVVMLDSFYIAVFLCMITAAIIFGGVEKIAKATNKLVPVMGLVYLGTALIVIFKNIAVVPAVFLNIIKSAFTFKAFGVGMFSVVIIGIQRGIFSNEAGLGTGSIASSTTSSDNYLKNGYVQVLGIYITTLLICTATAIIILTSNYQSLVLDDINGIEITQYAFLYHLGKTGNVVLFLTIILFSFSTILTGYYYGESSLKYFFKAIPKNYLIVLKLIALMVLFVGSQASPTKLWQVVDIFVSLLVIINMPSLYFLLNQVKFILKSK